MRGHRDLELAVYGTAVCAVLALLVPTEVVRLIVALPLALLLPGYAICAATFARRPLGRPHLFVFSIALSLTTLALGSLVLHFMPGGLRSLTWALLLLAVVLGASRAAALRRSRRASPPALPLPRVCRRQGGLALGGIAATILALSLAFTTLPANDAIGYTELWMLPRDDGTAGIEVGVSSQEQHREDYVLEIRFGDGREIVRRFSLDPGESEVLNPASRNAPADSKAILVTATVFRQDLPDIVYRRVTGWLPAFEAAG